MMIGLDKKLDVSGRWGGRANILEHDIWAQIVDSPGVLTYTVLMRIFICTTLLTLFNLVYLGNVFSG